jgi:hypothetical protein
VFLSLARTGQQLIRSVIIPVLCWLVLLPTVAEPRSFCTNISSNLSKVITGAIVLAIMVYAGATNFVIPAVLSVAAVLLVQHARSGWRLAPWCILAGACLWAIPLSAVKLVPALIFIRSYPRPYIEGTLFVDPIRLFEVLTASLFAPEVLPNGVSPVKGSPGFYRRHELEYSVYIVSLLLIVAALVSFILKPARPRHLLALMALVLVTGIPLALSFGFGNQTWGRILLHIPIINNNTTFVRWWSIYTFLLIVIAGLAFDRVCNERVRDIALGASMLIVVVQLASRNLGYYEKQGEWAYDPALVVAAIERLSQGVPLPDISQVGQPPKSKLRPGGADNDALVWGISAFPCYEPVFGYENELFPAHQLEAAPVNSRIDDHFNLVDARCYLSVDSRTCPAGSLFRDDQQLDVTKFTSHKPLPWQSSSQKYAERASSAASALSALLLLYLVLESAVRHYRIARARA